MIDWRELTQLGFRIIFLSIVTCFEKKLESDFLPVLGPKKKRVFGGTFLFMIAFLKYLCKAITIIFIMATS